MEEHRPDTGDRQDGGQAAGESRGTSEKLITHVTDRAGHDMRYAIDSRKLKRELAGSPACSSNRESKKLSNGTSKTKNGWTT